MGFRGRTGRSSGRECLDLVGVTCGFSPGLYFYFPERTFYWHCNSPPLVVGRHKRAATAAEDSSFLKSFDRSFLK